MLLKEDNLTYEQFMALSENPPHWEGETLFKLSVVTIVGYKQRRYPKYEVSKYSHGFFHTREEAEQCMRHDLSGTDEFGNRIFCYHLYEYPYSMLFNVLKYVSLSTYDAYGQLIEQTLYSDLWHEDSDYFDFSGRPAERVRFQKGDIVEVLSGDKVSLAVVVGLPPTPHEVWTHKVNIRQRLLDKYIQQGGTEGNFNLNSNPNVALYYDLDDCYKLIEGPSDRDHYYTDATSIFAPHFKIPDKIRQRFENYYKLFLKEQEDYEKKLIRDDQ